MKQLVLILLLGFSCHAQKLEIKKLTDDFYLYTTWKDLNGEPFPANGMYVVTENGVVIIDSPWDNSQCQPLLDSIGKKHQKKVVMAIATHFHEDRTGAFDFFKSKGIQTWSTKKTRKLCIKNGEQKAGYAFVNDTVFNFGKHSFRAFFPGEGHTKDNIVIWFPGQKIFYGGCLVKSTESPTLGNLADANIKAYPKTVEKLLAEFPDRFFTIPGHQSHDGDALVHTLELAQSLQKK